jgi:hypothetical protein
VKETENTTAREIERDEWDGLIANACYGWFGERSCEEAGVRDRAYIVSHRCTWYSYSLAHVIPGADIVEHGDLSVTVNGVRVPPGGAVTWTERRDVNAAFWEHAREAWNVQTWTPDQVLEAVSNHADGERAECHVFAPGVYSVESVGIKKTARSLATVGVLAVATLIPDSTWQEPLNVFALFAGGEFCGFIEDDRYDMAVVHVESNGSVIASVVDEEELNDIACSVEMAGTADENEVAACVIGERDQWENNARRVRAALAVEGANGDVRVTQEGVSLNGVSAKPGEALVWETWGDQVSHVHVADNDVVRLSMEEYEPTDYPGVSLVRLYGNTKK